MVAVGGLGILFLILLLVSSVPVGFGMAIIGLAGFSYVVNADAGLGMIVREFYAVFSSYGLTVIPLFVLMGQLAFHSGISSRLYDATHKLLGHRRGGLAMATVGACAAFSAICGSTNATAATMATVTVPEMKRFGYDARLATGTVASAGSLGILIPPSVVLIVYGILTEQSIGKLFAAGILPGLLLAVLFVATIYIQVRMNPEIAPPGLRTTYREKMRAMVGLIEALVLFGVVMGGMFSGLFTPTEAAAVGAFTTLAMGAICKNLSWAGFIKALQDTTRISAMIMVIVAGAMTFGKFMAITRVPFELASWVAGLQLHRFGVMGIILLIYLLGGCFMDSLAMVMLTVPIFFPVITALGFDPIWFGVIIVLVTEMGVITPPVGINVYVVYGVTRKEGVTLEDIFKGVFPFMFAIVVCCLMLLAFPQIALLIPGMMG
jgi:tripartite ATP-independent transporter DctM subunit